jgi:hypothetical protein
MVLTTSCRQSSNNPGTKGNISVSVTDNHIPEIELVKVLQMKDVKVN